MEKGKFEPSKKDLGINDWGDTVKPDHGMSVDVITTGANPQLKGTPYQVLAKQVTEASGGKLRVVHRPLEDNPYHAQIEPVQPMPGREARTLYRDLFNLLWKNAQQV